MTVRQAAAEMAATGGGSAARGRGFADGRNSRRRFGRRWRKRRYYGGRDLDRLDASPGAAARSFAHDSTGAAISRGGLDAGAAVPIVSIIADSTLDAHPVAAMRSSSPSASSHFATVADRLAVVLNRNHAALVAQAVGSVAMKHDGVRARDLPVGIGEHQRVLGRTADGAADLAERGVSGGARGAELSVSTVMVSMSKEARTRRVLGKTRRLACLAPRGRQGPARGGRARFRAGKIATESSGNISSRTWPSGPRSDGARPRSRGRRVSDVRADHADADPRAHRVWSARPVAVEAGVRAAFAAAVYGVISAVVLGGALLPNEIPRAVDGAGFRRVRRPSRRRSDPVQAAGNGVVEILFLSGAVPDVERSPADQFRVCS
jgi:hypothetical protein